MINPLAWVIDRLLEPVSDYPRVTATHDCRDCGAKEGGKHRISTCEGNSRDIKRRFLINYVGEQLSDDEVDRRSTEALAQHQRNLEAKRLKSEGAE